MIRPYAHPNEHLVDHLRWLEHAIDRWIAVRTHDLDEVRRLDRALVELDDEIVARAAAALDAGIELPILLVAARFELTPASLALLLAAALPGLDVQLAERWQLALAADSPERRVHEVVDLIAGERDRGRLLEQLDADRALQRGGLVRLLSGREWTREAPLLQRVVAVPDRVIAALRGELGFDPELEAFAGAYAGPTCAEGEHVDELHRWIAAREPRAVAVVGPALVGKTTAIATAAARAGRGTIVAELDALAASGDAMRLLGSLDREARLRDDVLVLRAGDGIEALPLALRRAAIRLVDRGAALVTSRDRAIVRALRAPRTIDVGVPGAAVQVALWRSQLGEGDGGSDDVTDAELAAIVARCSLPVGDIVEAAAAARSHRAEDLLAAARGRLQHRLSEVASLATTTFGWSDLVMREDVAQRVFEIIAAVQCRDHVLDTWGFADKLPYGRSISALLAGPPGTGKTMIATLIAKELGLELFRVDLSKVVSKWLGETEKNLGMVFDEAARVGAVLLFDEADALFAKRTEVRSSHDRNANLEVNYLLQRLEQHDGIVLLTTNAATSIDEAFKRRLRFRIELPAPDAGEREALWRTMIPERTPLAPDVDLPAIARRFNMAGGHIKNAVVRAAFLAAERGAAAIDQQTLATAAALEWTELGNLPT